MTDQKYIDQLRSSVSDAEDLKRRIRGMLLELDTIYSEKSINDIAVTLKNILNMSENELDSMSNIWSRDLPQEPLPELTEEERKDMPF